MAIVTNLSVKEIQQAIVDSYNHKDYRNNIFVPNVSWGLLTYEADLLIMNKQGYLTEIEIKRSWEDFMADFKKAHKHDDVQIYRLYYCLPKCLIDRARKWYEDQGRGHGCTNGNFAMMSYDENGVIAHEDGFGWAEQSGNRRKLFIEEQLQVARLGCIRLWNRKIK